MPCISDNYPISYTGPMALACMNAVKCLEIKKEISDDEPIVREIRAAPAKKEEIKIDRKDPPKEEQSPAKSESETKNHSLRDDDARLASVRNARQVRNRTKDRSETHDLPNRLVSSGVISLNSVPARHLVLRDLPYFRPSSCIEE